MEIIGKYGKCIIGDCIKVLEQFNRDKQDFDLLIADPPYNVNYDGNGQAVGGAAKHSKDDYSDRLDFADKRTAIEYENWCYEWFNATRTLTKRQLVFPSNKVDQKRMWYNCPTPPKYEIEHYKRNGAGRSYIANWSVYEPMLLFGSWKSYTFPHDVLDIPLQAFKREKWSLKFVKSYELYKYIITKANPTSVLDPFFGTGVTAQVCEELKIPWVGIEIMSQLTTDINRRIELGQQKTKERTLW